MGVSGSGKTRVGRALAAALGVPFIEGDAFHSPENIAKMRSGQALTDEDRTPWLAALSDALRQHAARGEQVVVACSALKQVYRDQLQAGGVPLRFVYLQAAPELIRPRVERRKRHFMPPALLQSQFDALEEPTDAIVLDASLPVPELVAQARAILLA